MNDLDVTCCSSKDGKSINGDNVGVKAMAVVSFVSAAICNFD